MGGNFSRIHWMEKEGHPIAVNSKLLFLAICRLQNLHERKPI